MVLASEVEFLGRYRLPQNVQSPGVHVVAVGENRLIGVCEAEHFSDGCKSANDAPLVIIGVLELIDDNQRIPVCDESPQSRTALQ